MTAATSPPTTPKRPTFTAPPWSSGTSSPAAARRPRSVTLRFVKGVQTQRGDRSRPNRNEGCESRIRHTLMSARRRGGSPGPATGESGGSARPEAGPAALAGNGGSPRAHVGRRRQHPAVGGRVCRRGARHGRAGAPVRCRRERGLCAAMKS